MNQVTMGENKHETETAKPKSENVQYVKLRLQMREATSEDKGEEEGRRE